MSDLHIITFKSSKEDLVSIAGNFTEWKPKPMFFNEEKAVFEFRLNDYDSSKDVLNFKFICNESWVTSSDYPSEFDSSGNENNIILPISENVDRPGTSNEIPSDISQTTQSVLEDEQSEDDPIDDPNSTQNASEEINTQESFNECNGLRASQKSASPDHQDKQFDNIVALAPHSAELDGTGKGLQSFFAGLLAAIIQFFKSFSS